MGAGLKIGLGSIEKICHKGKCRNGSAGVLKIKNRKIYIWIIPGVVAIVVINSGQHSGLQ